MTIRDATDKDLPVLVDFAKSVADYHHDIDAYYKPSYALENLEATIEDWFRDGSTKIFIAEDGGKAVGYIRGVIEGAPVYATPQKIGVVYDTFVVSERRQEGIGVALFSKLLEWFRTGGVKNIELNVDARNSAAIALWKKSGFKDYKLRIRMDL